MMHPENTNFIYVNREIRTLSNIDYDITLLDWLRTNLKLKGTKEGCAEGDCGACSVLVHDGSNSEVRPINSCLVRVGQVVGKGVITVEGIGNEKKPHPLQTAFIKENASQCGYCTPGFIISGISLLNSNKDVDENSINDAVSGNLCRCTGYSPIVKALKSVGNNHEEIKPIQFVEQNNDVQLGLVSYHNPINLDELLNLTNKPNFRYLAGGTDLNLQRPIINEDQNTIINLSNIKELKNIEVQNNKLLLGSAVTIENFLVTIKDRIPELIELLQRFGSPQIRNQGTIGGNLCTSSPIGDIAPIFLALNAKLNIFGSNGRKKVNLNEFYTGYRKNILTKDEIVSSIEVPLPKKDYNLFCWKLSKRYDQDISTISLTVYIKIRDQIIDDIHLAAGGIAETPKYLDNLCKDMIGQKLDKSISLAINNIKNYIKPISDIRGTADYRIESFRGLFRRLEKCLIDGVKTMSIMDFNNE